MRRHSILLSAAFLAALPPVLAAQPLVRVPGDTANLEQAFRRVSDGGVVEIAPGVYPSPADGFRMRDLRKSFTVRSGPGGRAVLDGGGSRLVLRLENSDPSRGGLVVFENLVFRDGFSDLDARAGGVTVLAGEARFVGCDFEDNATDPPSTGGGALAVHTGSTVEVLGGSFTGNSSKNRGGAMAVRDSFATVAGVTFTGNRTNLAGQAPNSAGGALYVLDAVVHVSDSLFEGNRAGFVGGAIFAFGIWGEPLSVPRTEVRVTRSTFLDNRAEPHPCCPAPGATTGGALHAEDHTTLTVASSRFEGNRARFGGAVDAFRAIVEIDGSVFRDNRDQEPGGDPGLGGALSAFSGDGPADPVNRRPAAITVTDSLFRGRDDGTAAAGTGGCLFAAGDTNRMYGNGDVQPQDDLGTNRAPVRLERTVFFECVAAGGVVTTGGAVAVALAELVLDDSLVLASEVTGDNSSGGGLAVGEESLTSVTGTSFAGNRAAERGGALNAQGSELAVSGARFLENEVSPGETEPPNLSLGAAIHTSPLFNEPALGRRVGATGSVADSLFVANVGVDVRDIEPPEGPLNEVRYEGNRFFANDFSGKVYGHNMAAPGATDVPGLNALTVVRAGGQNTEKGSGNQRIVSQPAEGQLLLVPPAGAPGSRTPAFLGFAWSGNQARLESPGGVRFAAQMSLPDRHGLVEADEPGVYRLLVNGQEVDSVTLEEEPPPPPPGPFLTSPEVPGFRFKVRISAGDDAILGRQEPGCIPETLCVSGALPGRSEAFLRVVGPKPNGFLWPTLVKFSTSEVEVWVEQEGTGELQYYVLAAASPGSSELPGLFDRGGFRPAGAAAPASDGAPALFPRIAPVLLPRGAPPLPPGPFLASPAVPGFRFKVRITAGAQPPREGRAEPVCIEETLCVSGAVEGRSELFLRVVGPKPNGFLWPHVVTFSTSQVEVWVEQTATGELQYYVLPAATPGSSDLSGLFDRGGFQP